LKDKLPIDYASSRIRNNKTLLKRVPPSPIKKREETKKKRKKTLDPKTNRISVPLKAAHLVLPKQRIK